MDDGFARRLRQLRKQRGISQRVLADLCGLGKNTISRYERGDISPTLPVLLALAEFFHVTSDDLAGRRAPLGPL